MYWIVGAAKNLESLLDCRYGCISSAVAVVPKGFFKPYPYVDYAVKIQDLPDLMLTKPFSPVLSSPDMSGCSQSSRWLNQSIRFCDFGTLGSGKTLSTVKEAFRFHLLHPCLKIFSNVPLNVDVFGDSFVPLTTTKQLFSIEEACFVLIDEAWHLADSRQIQSPENKALGTLLLRSRKRNWVVGYTQQWYTQLDLRLRFTTDIWIMPQFFQFVGVLQEDIYDLHANFLATRFYDGTKFYDLYDTTKDPLTLDIEGLEDEYDRKKARSW
jgi:hypothetical protein